MNPWFKHLAEVRKANPNIKNVGEIAKLAKKTQSRNTLIPKSLNLQIYKPKLEEL